jgi:hypothetical protein
LRLRLPVGRGNDLVPAVAELAALLHMMTRLDREQLRGQLIQLPLNRPIM